MELNNSIHNPIAAGVWVLAGAAGISWLAPRIDALRRELGFLGIFRVEADTPEEDRILELWKHIFGFFGALLLFYLLLDWLF